MRDDGKIAPGLESTPKPRTLWPATAWLTGGGLRPLSDEFLTACDLDKDPTFYFVPPHTLQVPHNPEDMSWKPGLSSFPRMQDLVCGISPSCTHSVCRRVSMHMQKTAQIPQPSPCSKNLPGRNGLEPEQAGLRPTGTLISAWGPLTHTRPGSPLTAKDPVMKLPGAQNMGPLPIVPLWVLGSSARIDCHGSPILNSLQQRG